MNTRKPTHPGLLLKEDILIPLGMTITEAAKDLGVSRKNLSDLINGRIALSPGYGCANCQSDQYLGRELAQYAA